MSVLRQAMARALAAAAILAITSMTAGAQGVTGTVTGTVKDAQGGVIPGATVTLISQTRGTTSVPVVTNADGDFVFPNLTADTYTIQVEMSSFRTLKRTGVEVNPGSRIALGTLTIDVGGTAEVVTVTAETPMIQAASGERSFSINTDSVANLPLANRSYDALLALAPGVNSQPGNLTPATRLGGGGDGNFMLDGATAMDPGVNRPASRVSVEAIAEVKLVTSGYQAEYGRSSGLQINAVTKSGSNRFHGSLYDVERNSKWNKNSKTNILNKDPKPFQDERDWGYSIGGPIGKPGGNNKLFFYFNHEMNPRNVGGNVTRYRVPTALERAGDFSQTTDNLGNPFPFIKDPLIAGTCSAASQVACFRDGGVLGKIPANRLYQSGLNILKWWPAPNIQNVPAGQAYNYEVTDPSIHLLGYQPIIRIDYQPFQSLRGSFKFVEYQQPNDVIQGTIPGFNDTKEDDYGIWIPAGTINWTVNSKTFVEGSFGANFHHQEGCSVSGGSPNFCRNGLPVNDITNRNTAGFGSIPYLFPDATKLDPNTFSYEVLSRNNLPIWDNGRVVAAPSFTWGGRVANPPPNNQGPFGNFILDTRVWNLNISLTRVQGSHTIKTGFYNFKSYQRRGQGAFLGSINFQNDTNNPLDSGFGFANAALGIFSQYSQLSRWGEGAYTAINQEAYVQDNWKLKRGITLDYGVRFVHQVPQYDAYLQSSNFLPEQWKASQAPALYVAGCANGVSPCTGTNRQAMNPLTGQFLGPVSSLAIGTIVPNTGSLTNGVFASGQGIVETNYKYPAMKIAPRVGAAWDPRGTQQFVVRGSAGLFFDRPQAQNVYNTVNNPPFSRNVTVRYGQLQDLSSAGLTTEAPPSLTVWQYDEPLPSSTQWNTGVQMMLPFNASLDVAYTGQHSFGFPQATNINAIDIGTAFLPQNQDRTQTSTTPGAASIAALNPDLARYYRGFSSISVQQAIQHRTYHSLQLSLQRRLRNGVSFGFADTMGLYDRQTVAQRLQHNADGTVTVRADQAKAQELLGSNNPQAHIMRANFIWQLPRLNAAGGAMQVLGHIVNDWSVSGIWTGATASAYTVSSTYQGFQNVNITGSPDYAPRVRIIGDPGEGCSSDPYRQFNTAAFAGPLVGSDGLESGNDYLKGCFISQLDLAIARTLKLGGARSLQLRVDVFNTFNQAGITNRQTTLQLNSPTDQTARNLPFDANGNLIPSLSLPRGAGFGVATGYQDPRTLQIQLRFQF
jgi:Carboxypeptidase regulatory-like domain